VDEGTQVAPLSPYAAGKLAGELYLRAYAGMYGIAPICLALADVYGPRQHPHGEGGVIAVFGRTMIAGRPVPAYPVIEYGDGADARDYVYVDDVVDAFVRAGTVTR
jgi:UDP-glucose 4-epimerase